MMPILFAVLAFRVPLPVEVFWHSLPSRSTVVWVGAHSDDEYLVAGALLAELSRRNHQVIVIAVTHGSSKGVAGQEYDAEAASVRRRDFDEACAAYRSHGCWTLDFPQLAHYASPGSDAWRESPEVILEAWRNLGLITKLSAFFQIVQPTLVLTLDPDHGMYGHPEHSAAARAVLLALPPGVSVYAAENRFRSITSDLDPGPIDWALPGGAFWVVGHDPDLYPSQTLPRIDLVPEEERFTFLRKLAR